MPAYKVELEEHTNSYESAQELYGEWSSSSGWYFRKITKVKDIEKSYADITSELDIDPGEIVNVVWLEYSTGDSFGHAYKGKACAVAIFKADSYEATEDFVKHINKQQYNSDSEYMYQNVYEALDGQKIHFYSEWSGYFETLEEVHIEHTRIM